jgi:hypothetical protein
MRMSVIMLNLICRLELCFPLEELDEQAWPGERLAVTQEAITLTADAWSRYPE